MKKILSLLLVGVMALSMIPTALATTDYTNGTQVKYEGQGAAQYTITVPAQLAPEGSGTVTLSGTWASDCKVKVTADTSVELTNSINAKDKKTLTVSFDGIEKYGDNTAVVTATEAVSVGAIDNALFGTWTGKFNYNVEYVEPVEMISFTYRGQSFQSEKGMTWYDWANSEYNTYRDEFSDAGMECVCTIKTVSGELYRYEVYEFVSNFAYQNKIMLGDVMVLAEDEIISGAAYTRGQNINY